jgi:hypothetical protein
VVAFLRLKPQEVVNGRPKRYKSASYTRVAVGTISKREGYRVVTSAAFEPETFAELRAYAAGRRVSMRQGIRELVESGLEEYYHGHEEDREPIAEA